MASQRKLKNARTMRSKHYRKTLLLEELQWLLLITIVTLAPVGVCLAVLRFQHAPMPF